MNVLVTSSRMPFALDEIRKFGRRGHRVFAADTFNVAPGSYSRYVAARCNVAAPASSPARFIRDVKQLVARHRIDLVVPCFEEVFYLARHLPELSEVFTSELALLARLHHKGAFNALAREIGIAAPETVVVGSRDELAAATRALGVFFARPVWSRGGLALYTNAGPLAGALSLDDCRPTPAQPWIVQRYVDGLEVCGFCVAQRGRVVAHCAYVHPKQIEHAAGIVFESVDDPEALACARRVVEATRYHGQISFDFRRTPRGLVVLECNPRPTAGVHMMPDDVLVDAVVAPRDGLRVVPAGVRRKYSTALVRDMVLHWRELGRDLTHLLSDAEDVYGARGDRLPALFQLLSYAHVIGYRLHHRRSSRRRTSLMAAYFDGLEWNGEAIP
jgi:hypothetical protein